MATASRSGIRRAVVPAAARALSGRASGSGAAIALLGILSCLPVYLAIYHLQSRGQSAAAIAMNSMHMNRMSVFWAFPLLQAAGIGALAWSYLGIMLGLVVSGRPPRWWRVSRPQTVRLHRQISLLVIALIAVHALATAEDAMGDSLKTAFVPWQASWTAAVFAYNLGIFALYLAVLLGPTYYLRNRIGTRWWMLAHRAALAVYVLSVWHALLLGADFSYYGWLRTITWLAQVPLLVLLTYRVLKTRHRGPVEGGRRWWLAPVRYWLAAMSAVAIIAVAALVGTGHGDLLPRVGSSVKAWQGHPDLLPGWLGIALAALAGLAAISHLAHLAGGPRTWAWHGTHVLMGLGMIAMLLPLRKPLVPPVAGEITFAAASVAAAVVCAAQWRRGRRAAVLALVTGTDLAIMAYMFAAPGGGTWPTCLFCGWLTMEAAYCASGRIAVLAGHSTAARERAGTATPTVPKPAGHLTVAGNELRATQRRRAELMITLAFMSLCMAYMLLAMHYGMGAGAGMPRIGGMPGMPSVGG